MPHRIRLAAPWTWELTADKQLLRMVRHFHRPTGLQPNQPLWLCWETNLSGVDSPRVLINHRSLPSPPPNGSSPRVSLSSELQPHNTIELVFRTSAIAGWPLCDQTTAAGRTRFNPSAATPWLSAVWLLIEELPVDHTSR
jgi:hypothetical protein